MDTRLTNPRKKIESLKDYFPYKQFYLFYLTIMKARVLDIEFGVWLIHFKATFAIVREP